MKRSALALLGLLALPLAAAAQDRPLLANEPPPERLPEPRIIFTPFIGARVPFNTGDQVVFAESGSQFRFAQERGGGVVAGANVAVRAAGPVRVVVGAAYSGAEQDIITVTDIDGNAEQIEVDGPAMLFAKAGVQVRLPDPLPDNRRHHPSAFVTVAPALVWLDWDDIEGAPPGFTETTQHFALNLGLDAITRLGRSSRWALNVALEDYVVFWDTDELRVRDAAIGQVVTGEPVTIDYDYGTSNIFTLRVGVSFMPR